MARYTSTISPSSPLSFPSSFRQSSTALRQTIRDYPVWDRCYGRRSHLTQLKYPLLLKVRLFGPQCRPIHTQLGRGRIDKTERQSTPRQGRAESVPPHGYANPTCWLFQAHLRPYLDALTGTKDAVSDPICPHRHLHGDEYCKSSTYLHHNTLP